jgi:hypothetical protein
MSIVPASLDMKDLGDQVRNWVHYDNLVSTLNKQVQFARQTRDKYEDDIIRKLRSAKYEKAVLQIAGGRILLADDRHSKPITYTSLEESLHAYFRQKQGLIRDETADILKFIKGNRQVEVSQRLKRQNVQSSSQTV